MQTEQIHQPTIRDILASSFFRERKWVIIASTFSIGGTAAVISFIFMSIPDVFGAPWALGGDTILLTLLVIILASFWQRLRQHVLWQRYSITTGGTHSYDAAPSAHTAFVFQRGINRNIADQVISPTSLPFAAIGNYSYCYYLTYKDQEIPFWRRRISFLSLKLPRHLPHIVLDSTSNNLLKRVSEYSIELQGLQRLELEGDFNDYFTLYVPQGYERDALYIFSPDVMELMVRHASRYDVEIVDDTLYLFAPGRLDVTDSLNLARLATLGETLLGKLDRSVVRYADQTIEDKNLNVIAPAGQRLRKRTISIIALVFIAFSTLMIIQLLT